MQFKQKIKEALRVLLRPETNTGIPGLAEFKRLADGTRQRFLLREEDYYPCLDDNTAGTGFDRHYVYHPAWAADAVKEIAPDFHVDISSTLHFAAILSAFIPVRFYDYRPAAIELPHLSSGRADLTALDFPPGSITSLSCMHTVEHIGLGRYGDRIDYDGDLKAMSELSRVLAPGGSLLFVVPLGATARIQFNAHRIYTKELITETFDGLGLTLKEFTLIPENEADGGLVNNPPEHLLARQSYGCGCFWFVKP